MREQSVRNRGPQSAAFARWGEKAKQRSVAEPSNKGIEKKMAKAAVATTGGGSTTIVDRGRSWLDRTKGFLTDVRAEMKKVNYPNVKEVRATTVVVIITVFIFGLYFYVIDSVIQFGLDHLLKLFK